MSLPSSPQPKTLALRDTVEVNLLGIAAIPMLAFIAPRVLQNDGDGTRVMIPLRYRTKNHMGSMYFGVLAAGADLASGLPVVRLMRERGQYLVPSFKDLHAEFLRRATGDVVFETQDIASIEQAYDEAVRTGQRVNLPVRVIATVPSEDPGTPVARFTTTLSIRHKAGEKMPLLQRLMAKF